MLFCQNHLKNTRRRHSFGPVPAHATAGGPSRELAELRARLTEAEETLKAICAGEVDAVVVPGAAGPQVSTLEDADHAYRALIESMNEGALTLTEDATILYANQCFSRMVKRPLQQLMGASFHRFLSTGDQAALRPLLQQPSESGTKTDWLLHADDGSHLPAHISIRALPKNSCGSLVFGLVVSDMTEARQNEAALRALTNRLVQVQESERGLLANDLRVNITQLLYVILGRCESLAEKKSSHRRFTER